jgi:hypothetical protein
MIPYIIKSWRGGISDENDKGIAGSYKFGYGLDIHGRNDTLKAKQAMVQAFGNSDTTQTGIIKWFVNSSDGTTYCFGSTGSVFARSGDGIFNFVYNDENGDIRGATEFQLEDGVNYLLWATATSIARKVIPGVTVAPDSHAGRWTDVTANWKTTLDDAEWHSMVIAGGQTNIANGNYLASIAYDGSFDPADLDIIPGNIIKCLEERDDYVILGSYRSDKSEEGHIWSWLTSATNWIQKKRIPVKGVNSLITAETMLLQGGSDGELFYSDFISAIPLHGIPGGGSTMPGGVSIEDDLAVFGVYGGDYPGIWSYGRKRKNRAMALNYDYRLANTVAGSTISTIAAVTTADGLLMASWGTTDESTSEYGIDIVDENNKAYATYEGLEFSNGQHFLKKKFDTVKLNMAPMPASTYVSVLYKFDKQPSWKYAFMGNGETSYSYEGATEAIFSIGGMASTYEVRVDTVPFGNETPEILSITTYIGDSKYAY